MFFVTLPYDTRLYPDIYIFVIETCCSYYNLCDLGWGYLTHHVTWLIDPVITWYEKNLHLRWEWPLIICSKTFYSLFGWKTLVFGIYCWKNKESNCGVNVMRKMNLLLPCSSLLTVYKCFIRPHLSYGDMIYEL